MNTPTLRKFISPLCVAMFAFSTSAAFADDDRDDDDHHRDRHDAGRHLAARRADDAGEPSGLEQHKARAQPQRPRSAHRRGSNR